MINQAALPPRYLGFGISFMLIYGLGSLVLVILGVAMASLFGSAAAIIVMIGVAMLAYCVTAGVLCIKRNIVGVYMGLGLVALSLLGTLASFGNKNSSGGGNIFNLMLNGGLVAAAVFDIKRHNTYKQLSAMGYGMPMQRRPMQQPYEQQAYGQEYQQQPTPYQQPAPVQRGASPRAAVLQVLALTASIEPDFALPRLERARTAAKRLLGEKVAAEIEHELGSAVAISDVNEQLAQYAPSIANNPKLAESLRKCVEFVLKEGGEFTPSGSSFYAQYEATMLGAAAPAPAARAALPKPRGLRPRAGGASTGKM